MDKQRAISHFLYYLEHHPALAGINPAKVLLGHTADYQALTGAIAEQVGDSPRFSFSAMRLDLEPTELLAQAIADSDLYIFFYDSSTRPNPRPEGPEFIRALQGVMAENWKKSLLFKGLRRLLLRHVQCHPAAHCRVEQPLDPAHVPRHHVKFQR